MKIAEMLENVWHKKLSRREFLRKCFLAGIGAGASLYLLDGFSKYKACAAIKEKRGMHEALFYEPIGEDSVRCLLCPNYCVLSEGKRSFCRVREPIKNKLYTLVYELISSIHVDPIEKKPLFHVLPGSKALSIATAGCNSRCKFCQNWTISQEAPENTDNRQMRCEEVVSNAILNNCASIAYTYNEPTVFYEYMLATGKLAKQQNVLNIMVTGGKINPEPLKRLCAVIDAANVDLKGFDADYMQEVCAQNLKNILETLVIMREANVWVEITNLIVPTLNDNMSDIRRMAQWIKKYLGTEVPLHFSRFWPQYKLQSLYPTPVETLKKARDIALEEGLSYVYIGNVPEFETESTICPGCGKMLIKRIGYQILENHVTSPGICDSCGSKIAGIFKIL